MIISRAPFRISFFGGGTDFPAFFNEHGGRTLLTTIDKFCYLSLHELSPFFKYRYRASYARTELVQQASEFQHPLVRECLLFLNPDLRLEITHVSDLPGRTGLGTSSAFTVALLHALHVLLGHKVTPGQLAREAITIERERVGDPGGHQDQYAAAYGGLLHLDFSGPGQVGIQRLDLPGTRSQELEDHLLMFYTGLESSAGEILRRQESAIPDKQDVLRAMCDTVDRAQAVLCGPGPLLEFGDLLHAAWQMKKGLAQGITNSGVDQAYDAARRAGARGGKLCGAGGRGFLLLFCEPERQPAVRAALRDLLEVPFAFSSEGSSIIFRTENHAKTQA
ncbi:MAG: kinase [Kiritimatiellae bacterium]|nr:kinase [Kiritimatiellia bacterium]